MGTSTTGPGRMECELNRAHRTKRRYFLEVSEHEAKEIRRDGGPIVEFFEADVLGSTPPVLLEVDRVWDWRARLYTSEHL